MFEVVQPGQLFDASTWTIHVNNQKAEIVIQ